MSWFEDDNFILEDDLAPDFEVPFLSMDLHALATKLSKIKLSQRLFMEEDLLPEDMAVASEDEDDEILIQLGTTLESDAKGSFVQHNFRDIKPGKDAVSPDHASNIHSDDPMKTHLQSECFAEEATTSFKVIPRPMQSDTETYTGITGTVPNAGHREQSKLGMVAPEEELDMLLNSLDGTHLSSSNLDESFGSSSTLVGMKINESNEKVVSSSTTSKSLALSPVDDDLDALLSETSLSVQNDGSAASSLSSRPTFDSNSNVDFRYAKQIDVTSIDDSVDDLLANTPFCLSDQKQATPVQGQQNISNANAPPPSGSSNLFPFMICKGSSIPPTSKDQEHRNSADSRTLKCQMFAAKVHAALKPIIYLDTLPMSQSRYYHDLYTHNTIWPLHRPKGYPGARVHTCRLLSRGQPRDSSTLCPSSHGFIISVSG
ncbi:hypothetical protein TRIUR3_03632 [Triticum urartu]|uniref:Uncharacterized protein n=1 Tax=Triticum urartu TaxID=4572 RepID=M7ZHS6_TRIUA|nr:hypothetical protein TRIUR3_03632 [Triticum urartu]